MSNLASAIALLQVLGYFLHFVDANPPFASSTVINCLKNKMGGKIDCYLDCGRIASPPMRYDLICDLD